MAAQKDMYLYNGVKRMRQNKEVGQLALRYKGMHLQSRRGCIEADSKDSLPRIFSTTYSGPCTAHYR